MECKVSGENYTEKNQRESAYTYDSVDCSEGQMERSVPIHPNRIFWTTSGLPLEVGHSDW